MICTMSRDTPLPAGNHPMMMVSGGTTTTPPSPTNFDGTNNSSGGDSRNQTRSHPPSFIAGTANAQELSIPSSTNHHVSAAVRGPQQPRDESVTVLPPSFVPGRWDVICQRGKECFDHVGNRRFRMCIDRHLNEYMTAKNRQRKSKIVSNIINHVQTGSAGSGGGFVRKDLLTRRWFKVGEKHAREKVGQALRDAIKSRRAASGRKTSQSPLLPDSSSARAASPRTPTNQANAFNYDTGSSNNSIGMATVQSGGTASGEGSAQHKSGCNIPDQIPSREIRPLDLGANSTTQRSGDHHSMLTNDRNKHGAQTFTSSLGMKLGSLHADNQTGMPTDTTNNGLWSILNMGGSGTSASQGHTHSASNNPAGLTSVSGGLSGIHNRSSNGSSGDAINGQRNVQEPMSLPTTQFTNEQLASFQTSSALMRQAQNADAQKQQQQQQHIRPSALLSQYQLQNRHNHQSTQSSQSTQPLQLRNNFGDNADAAGNSTCNVNDFEPTPIHQSSSLTAPNFLPQFQNPGSLPSINPLPSVGTSLTEAEQRLLQSLPFIDTFTALRSASEQQHQHQRSMTAPGIDTNALGSVSFAPAPTTTHPNVAMLSQQAATRRSERSSALAMPSFPSSAQAVSLPPSTVGPHGASTSWADQRSSQIQQSQQQQQQQQQQVLQATRNSNAYPEWLLDPFNGDIFDETGPSDSRQL